jgi:hypothetical protein
LVEITFLTWLRPIKGISIKRKQIVLIIICKLFFMIL